MPHYGVGRSLEGCAAAASENSSGPWEFALPAKLEPRFQRPAAVFCGWGE